MKILSIVLFLAFCATGSVAELDNNNSNSNSKFNSNSRGLQYDDDSRVTDEDESEITTSGPAFPNGTRLGYYVESLKKWVNGSVVGFEDGSYYVEWDDKPGRVEAYDSHFSGDRLRLEAMEMGASRVNDDSPTVLTGEIQAWENGTPVRIKNPKDGSVRVGSVVEFNKGIEQYKVRYSDGTTEYYDDYGILPLVQLATARQQYIIRVSIFGSIAGFMLIVVLWLCFRRCCASRREPAPQKGTATPDPELGLDEEKDMKEESDVDNKSLPSIN